MVEAQISVDLGICKREYYFGFFSIFCSFGIWNSLHFQGRLWSDWERDLHSREKDNIVDKINLHRTWSACASWTLRCNASLLLWHVYTMPFISCVTLTFNSSDETVPPHNPGFDALFMPSTGMPSFHQLNLAGGLLELESQMSVASTPGTSSAGSTRILTVSGATVHFKYKHTSEKSGERERKKTENLVDKTHTHTHLQSRTRKKYEIERWEKCRTHFQCCKFIKSKYGTRNEKWKEKKTTRAVKQTDAHSGENGKWKQNQ